jgi:hypothetical protein
MNYLPISVSNSSVTCSSFYHLIELKSKLSLSWGLTNISDSLTLISLKYNYLERINRTVDFYPSNSTIYFEFPSPMSSDLNSLLFCKYSTYYFAANVLSGSQTKYFCEIPFSMLTGSISYQQYYVVEFYYKSDSNYIKIGLSPLIIEKFG